MLTNQNAPGNGSNSSESRRNADFAISAGAIQSSTNSLRSLFTSFLITVSFLAIFCMLFSRLGRWFFLAELMGNFQLQIGIIGLSLPLILWARGARRTAWATFVVSLMTLVNPLWSFVPYRTASLPGQSLRLMSFNLLAANRDEAAIRSAIGREDLDVLLFVEYTPFMENIRRDLTERFPYQVIESRLHGFGIALFSRFPILNQEVQYLTVGPLEKPSEPPYFVKDDPYIDVTLDVNGNEMRVIGVHLFNPTEYARFSERTRQFQKLIGVANQHRDKPLVVMGDFNCTPWSSFFMELQKKASLRDSRQGFGYQGTWPVSGDFLSIPIDHILVSDGIEVVQRTVLPAAGSDHYPIYSEIIIGKD
jgi:endonuclease/exonuclease/phosphatase (EEP) superfamily protein YafD